MDFNFGYKGTSINSLLNAFNHKVDSLIVFDYTDVYGTTCKLEDLKNSELIENLKLTKMTYPNCLVENIPKLFLGNGELIRRLKQVEMHQGIDFLEISDHLYIDENLNVHKLPYCDFDILNSKWLTIQEKTAFCHLVHQDIPYETFESLLNARSLEIFKGFFDIFGHTYKIADFLFLFGDAPFRYPTYGESEVSNQLSRILAFRNIAFYVNKDLNYKKINNHHELEGVHGTATFKELIEDDESVKSLKQFCFRVVLLNKPFISKTFFSVLKMADQIINVFSLDHSTRVCPENTFLVYFYSDQKLPENLFNYLMIEEKCILNDVSFCSKNENL